jgi:uncharacterized membrane protein
MIYKTLFVEKEEKPYLLFSTAACVGFLLWLKLIVLELGMLLLALVFCVLFSKAYSLSLGYLEKTHFGKYYPLLVAGFFVVVLITGIYPSYVYAQQTVDDSITAQEVLAMEWMKEYTPIEAKIAARMEEGHYITGISHRKVMADSYHIRMENIDQIYTDIDVLYTTRYQTPALEILDRYDVDYIFLSKEAQSTYGIPVYLDSSCFDMVLNYTALIYAVKCDLEGS